jgi:hypothetical protein
MSLLKHNPNLRTALDLLELFVDDERCSFDHHGTCQTHFSVGDFDNMCGNAAAREFLDEMRPGWSE